MRKLEGYVGISFKIHKDVKDKLDWICNDKDIGLSTLLRDVLGHYAKKHWRGLKNES